MASIVYITDRRMIEYHRLNGNRTMNFWRPGSMRRMSDFHPGDLLFFLAKGTERGIAREKGIVGYGKYQKSHTMTFKQLWKNYGTENGYDNEKELREAILRVSKNKKMPKNLSGLYLRDVVYFQAPIYLSEIGVSVSNMVESYFYLDKDDPLATTKILKKAQEVGMDTWMAMLQAEETEKEPFEADACRHVVAEALQRINPVYNESETRKAKRIAEIMKKELDKQCANTETIRGDNSTFLCLYQKKIEIFIPLVSTIKEMNYKLQLLIGHALILKGFLKQKLPEYTAEVSFLVDATLTSLQKQMLRAVQISYLYVEKPSQDSEASSV